jgi:hypothetical protein
LEAALAARVPLKGRAKILRAGALL